MLFLICFFRHFIIPISVDYQYVTNNQQDFKKKVMIALMMVVATSTASFAKTSNEQMKTAAKEVAQTVKDAPSGTTYGVVEVTKSQIVINTPLGRHTINKNEDGSFSFLGMTAKLVSAKNGIYKVKTSLGTFSVNTRKATITKL